MAKHILRCVDCQAYNLTETCRVCGGKAVLPKPPKYSIEDKYAKYRRMAKEQESTLAKEQESI